MTFSFRNLSLPLIALVLTSLLAHPVSAQTRYRNVRNDKFATVSSGPQSAIIIDTVPGEDAGTHQTRVRSVLSGRWTRQAQSLRGQIAALRKSGYLKPQSVIPVSTVIYERSSGKLVTPAAQTRAAGGRAFGGGALTFRFTGFPDADAAFLQSFVNLVYPRIVNLYGAPAITGEVEIVNSGESQSNDVSLLQALAFGAYNASTNQILVPRYSGSIGGPLNNERMLPALLLNLIHAFHGPAVLQYDAWEQGMARAASAIISRDPAVQAFANANGASHFTDPSENISYSLLRFYELLNQPALGNSTFFPASQANVLDDNSFGKMFYPRLGMSGAVWLKVYIENQSFFRQFNADYYQQVSANANLAGDVPSLRTIAAGKLPNGVEGITFNDWFTRQYVLDTSVSLGPKLYAFVIPFDPEVESQSQSPSVGLVYFNTKSDGDETLLNGIAYATYLDTSNSPVQLGEASKEIVGGEGLITILAQTDGSSGVGRYSLNFAVGGLVARTYFPIGFSTDFQGVVVGANSLSGSLTFQQTSLPPVSTRSGTTSVNNGAFGRSLGSPATDLSVTTVTYTNAGITSTFRFNTGDGRYYAILRPQGATTTVSKAFSQTSLPQLVSFPVRPLSAQADVALGLPSTSFLLNTWNNAISNYTAFSAGQPGTGRLEPGIGYWFKVAAAAGGTTTVNITGTPPPTDTDYTIAAPLGWSLIGSPFGTDINLADLRVQYLQNDPVAWADAVGGLVQPEVYGFDQTSGYQTTTVLKGTQWQGYWIRTRVPGGVTLILPGPDSPSRSRAYRSAITRAAGVPAVPTRSLSISRSTRPDWSVHLTAEQATGGPVFTNSDTVTLGGAKSATKGVDGYWDTEAPPAITTGVQTAFAGTSLPSGRATGGHLVSDFRDSDTAARSGIWDVTVTTPVSGLATLRWDGIGTAPRRTRLTLVDTVSGVRIPLRSRASYTWTGEAGKTRAFKILSEPERSLPLAITNVNVQPVRNSDGTRSVSGGGGVVLSYTVVGDSDPQVDVAVSLIGGKVLRHLDSSISTDTTRAVTGTSSSAQQRSVRWDGRGADGASLPAGTYLLTITARGTDGTLARVQRPILSVR